MATTRTLHYQIYRRADLTDVGSFFFWPLPFGSCSFCTIPAREAAPLQTQAVSGGWRTSILLASIPELHRCRPWCVLELPAACLRECSCLAWERNMSDWANRLLNSLLPRWWLSPCRKSCGHQKPTINCWMSSIYSGGTSPFVGLYLVGLIWLEARLSRPSPRSFAEGCLSPATKTRAHSLACPKIRW